MKRRTINLALGLAASAWSAPVRAQQSGKPLPSSLRVGVVEQSSWNLAYAAMVQRFGELGLIEGRNLTIDHDYAFPEHMDTAYAGMVSRGTDVLLALGSESVLKSALRAAAGRVPVVCLAMDYDLLRSGYVTSLARPGANLTGIFVRQPELAIKRLEIARDVLPKARRVALWWDGNVARDQYDASSAAASSLRFEVQSVEVGNVSYDFPGAAKRTSEIGAEAIVLASSISYYHARAGIALSAREAGLPLIAFAREFVEVGALVSYGVNTPGIWRRVADYVARIAAGARPSDLPIDQPTAFELCVNLKTAASLGLSLTPAVLGRADEVFD